VWFGFLTGLGDAPSNAEIDLIQEARLTIATEHQMTRQ